MDTFDDMPPLVEANPQPNIPPPPGATFTAPSHPTPHNAQAGWNSSMPQPFPPFPTQLAAQDQWARWSRHLQGTAAPETSSMPSPYIPHATFPQSWGDAQQGPIRRASSLSAAHPPPYPQQQASSWNAPSSWPFHIYVRPPMYSFPTYPSARSHTPSSMPSTPRSLSGPYVPPDWPGEPPKSWRRDFRFKSRFMSLFRSKSVPRPAEGEYILTQRSVE